MMRILVPSRFLSVRIMLPANLGVGVDLRARRIELGFTGSRAEATAGLACYF